MINMTPGKSALAARFVRCLLAPALEYQEKSYTAFAPLEKLEPFFFFKKSNVLRKSPEEKIAPLTFLSNFSVWSIYIRSCEGLLIYIYVSCSI